MKAREEKEDMEVQAIKLTKPKTTRSEKIMEVFGNHTTINEEDVSFIVGVIEDTHFRMSDEEALWMARALEDAIIWGEEVK